MRLRKLAQDLVMRMQKIDGDNYPEVGVVWNLMCTFGCWRRLNIGLVYWRQTLNQMYIVNAGNGFSIIWNTVKGFLDPKTSSKIHVLKNKDRSHLLEIIDPRWEFLLNNPVLLITCSEADTYIASLLFNNSELPDFLGGNCSCASEGGCIRFNKGPWNDPEIMKVWFSICSTVLCRH